MTFMEGAKGRGTVKGDTAELQSAIETIVDYYEKYATKKTLFAKEGIRKGRFREMLKNELNHMLKDTEDRKAADQLIRDLNENQDGVIDFDEYWEMIRNIAIPFMKYQVEKTATASKGDNPP